MSRHNHDPLDPDALTQLQTARSYVADIKAKLDRAHHLVAATAVALALDNLTEAINLEKQQDMEDFLSKMAVKNLHAPVHP